MWHVLFSWLYLWLCLAASCPSCIGWVLMRFFEWLLLLAMPEVHGATLSILTAALIVGATTSGLRLAKTVCVNILKRHWAVRPLSRHDNQLLSWKHQWQCPTIWCPNRPVAYPGGSQRRFVLDILSSHRNSWHRPSGVSCGAATPHGLRTVQPVAVAHLLLGRWLWQ